MSILLLQLLLILTILTSIAPFGLVITTKLVGHYKIAPKIPGHGFEVWGYLYGGKVRLVTCVLYSLLQKDLISIDKRFVHLKSDNQSNKFNLTKSENLFLRLLGEKQPYKLYQIYSDDRFLQHISGIHQTLKSEGLFYELPRPLRIIGVLLPGYPVVGYYLLALFGSEFPFYLYLSLAVLQITWFLVFSMVVANDFLNYKAPVSNLKLEKISKEDGTEFTEKEREIIAHGLPKKEDPLRKLVSSNSKSRRIEFVVPQDTIGLNE